MRKPYKALLALFITLTAGSGAFAAHVSPDGALARALKSDRLGAPDRSAGSYSLALTEDDEVYVFCRPDGGYLVLPADDAAPAILGYADGGTFSADAMPPAMKWWLGEYARQLKHGGMAPAQKADRAPIAPLCSTRWNQDAPYNNMCPTVGTQRSVTGCAATAMAQVMKYHNWPEKGTGSHSYTWNNTTLSMDFANTTFDWANMLDSYTGTSTAAQKQAVAQLMYACGVSIDMDYSPSASGAPDFYIAAAMANYFGYDAGIRYYSRDYYGINDWNDLVYGQLAEYGPVQYSGQSSEGGHSFVCDGYSSDGYFHINWGWGGMSDGYFLLSALDPGVQGIGGSTSGFNYVQSFIGCVRKPVSGSKMYVNYMMESFEITQSSARLGSNINVTGSLYNFSTGIAEGTLGIKAVNSATGETTYITGPNFANQKPLAGFSGYTVSLPTRMSAGTYILTPALRTTDGDWQDVPVALYGTRSVTMTISATTAYFSANQPAIAVSGLKMESVIYIGQQCHITATISNEGDSEYYSAVAPGLVNNAGTVVAIGDSYAIDINGGESIAMDYVGSFGAVSGQIFRAGTFTMYLFDMNTGSPLSDGITVKVNARPSTTTLSVSPFSVVGDANAVDPDNLSFTGTVNCTAGYFGGSLAIAIFPYSTSGVSAIDEMSSDPVFIGAGQTAALKASGKFSAAEPGKKYMAAVFNGNTMISELAIFTIDSKAGIGSTVVADGAPTVYPTLTDGTVFVKGDDIRLVNVYSTTGALLESTQSAESIDLSHYPSGLYLIEIVYGPDATQRIINRVIRR